MFKSVKSMPDGRAATLQYYRIPAKGGYHSVHLRILKYFDDSLYVVVFLGGAKFDQMTGNEQDLKDYIDYHIRLRNAGDEKLENRL